MNIHSGGHSRACDSLVEGRCLYAIASVSRESPSTVAIIYGGLMAGEQGLDKEIGFKTIILLKDQTLGIGAYGSVCKAKCDDLLCAAKIIHQTLFDPTALHQIATHREHRLPIRRFQLECEFLSTVRHPNIVQYLGTH